MPLPPKPAARNLERARRAAGLLVVTATVTGAGALSACGGGEPAPATTEPVAKTPRVLASGTAPARTTGVPVRSSTTSAEPPPTTSTLGAFPPVRASSPSPIDAGAIRSAQDLPAAFQCLPQVTPILVPGTGGAPSAVVCPSRLADGDALYLWFVDTPDARYLALEAALARSAFVRGGPNWVAGGARAAAVAGLGGQVYR